VLLIVAGFIASLKVTVTVVPVQAVVALPTGDTEATVGAVMPVDVVLQQPAIKASRNSAINRISLRMFAILFLSLRIIKPLSLNRCHLPPTHAIESLCRLLLTPRKLRPQAHREKCSKARSSMPVRSNQSRVAP
jgi:hypothetical protein